MAAKRRRQSTRLENLGIPEEELLRQQQELFARFTLKYFLKFIVYIFFLRAREAAVQEEQGRSIGPTGTNSNTEC